MAAVTEVTAVYRADTSSYVRGAKQAQAATQQFAAAAGQANQAAGGMKASTVALGTAVGLVAVQALTKATAKVKEFAMQGIQAAASYEQTVISIEGIFVGMGMTVGQATEQTKEYLGDLRDFAATTPFELPQTLDAVKRLLSIGYAADDVKDRLLPAIGDIVSALGQPASSINGVVYAMGQMKSAGRVMAQDLMQIGNALPGFNARMEIAKELFNGDMQAMAAATESGALDSERAIEALLSAMQKFPGAAGAMERQSKTLNGVISTFKDTVNNALIDGLLPTMPVLSSALNELVGPVSTLAKAFAMQLGPLLVDVTNKVTTLAPDLASLTAALMTLSGTGMTAFIQVAAALAPILTAAAQAVAILAGALTKMPSSVLAVVGALIVMRLALKKFGIDWTTANLKVKAALASMKMSVIGTVDTIRLSFMLAGVSLKTLGLAFAQFARTAGMAIKAVGASMKALMTSLGPVGIALIALTAPLEIFMGNAAGTQNAVSNLRGEIDATTGSLTKMGREFIATELRTNISTDDLAMLESYGISISGYIDALESGGPALDEYMAKIDAMVAGQMGVVESFNGTEASARTIARTLQGMAGDYAESTEASRIDAAASQDAAAGKRALVSATVASAIAMGESMGPTDGLKMSVDGVAAAADAAAAAIESMRLENEAWTSALSDISAADAAITAIDKIGASAVDNSNRLVGTKPAIVAFRGDVIAAFEASAAKAADLTDNTADQRKMFTGELVKIVAALRASKVSDSDIETFLGSMDKLPMSVGDIMRAAGVAVGRGGKEFKTDVEKTVTSAFKDAAKRGTPMTADAMEQMAKSATAKAKEKMGLTLEPELAAVIKSASTGLAATAKVEGEAPGYNLVSGMAAGVDRGSYLVKEAVERVIEAAKAAADAASRSQSPSKLFMEVGDNLIQGLRLGWNKGNKDLISDIARTVQDAWWAMQDSKDAIVDAKKALKDVRAERDKGEASARDVAAAERAVAKAYRDSADAANAYAEAQRNVAAYRKLARMPAVSSRALTALTGFDITDLSSLDIAQKIVDNLGKALDHARRILVARATQAGMTREAAEAYADSVMDTFTRSIERQQRRLQKAMEQLAEVRQQIEKLESEATDRRNAGQSIAKFITSRFGETSEFDKAYASATMTIDQAVSLFDQFEALIKQRYSGLDTDEDDAMIQLLRNQTTKLVGLIKEREAIKVRLDEAEKDLKALIDARESMEQKVADSIRGFFKPSGKISSADEYITGLNQRIDATNRYMKDLEGLRKRGLAQATISQILEMGVEQGGALAAALAAGSDAQLAEVNALTATAEGLATSFGTSQADLMYAAGVASQQALVDGITTEFTTKQGEIDAVVAEIKAMFSSLTDSNIVAGEAAAMALLTGLKNKEKELLDYITTLAEAIRTALLDAMNPPTPGRNPRRNPRTTPTAVTPIIPYTATTPSVAVAAGGVQVSVTVGDNQNPEAVKEAVRLAVMEALSEVASRASNARR